MGDFDLIETMAFDPEEGVLRIERHLARIRASAEALGFAFDRHAARNELQAATFRLRAPAKVRLLATRSGGIAIEVGPLPARPASPLRVALIPQPFPLDDIRLRHRTGDDTLRNRARVMGVDELAFLAPDGAIAGGSTGIFAERGGGLVTPRQASGILRDELIAQGRAIAGDVRPDALTHGFFVGNALSGLLPAVVAVAKSHAPSL